MNDNIPVQPRELKAVHSRLDEIGKSLTDHILAGAIQHQATMDASKLRDDVLQQILDQATKTNGRVNIIYKWKDRVMFGLMGMSLVLSLIFGGIKLYKSMLDIEVIEKPITIQHDYTTTEEKENP
jgi:5-hydroxyisourate hydrolase-like protein (transthyretin family)